MNRNALYNKGKKRGAKQSDPADFVWATSETARQRAETLHLIGSIVHRHGGTVKVDMYNDALHIKVPDEEKTACAQELEERAGLAWN